MEEIKIFSPGTVANVACGFDVLGFCLDHIGDEMIVRKKSEPGIQITKIEGLCILLNVRASACEYRMVCCLYV